MKISEVNFAQDYLFNKGLLGMGFQSIATSQAQTVFGNFFAQGQISENIFSFYLNR